MSSADMMDGVEQSRVDVELVRRGLAKSRGEAAAFVRDGRVRLAGKVVAKPSAPVVSGAGLVVRAPEGVVYVSRAALKLAGALDALGATGPIVDGSRCLDVGASTGGFTDVLLRRGAAQVLAIDVGHGQLVTALREDPRVSVREGLNARDLTREDVSTPPDLVVGDVSFISLRMILPALVNVIGSTTDLLLMVKPQFEVGRERLGRGGVVRDLGLQAEAVRDVAEAAGHLGLRVHAVVPSPLPGPSGNREYFLWLQAGGGPSPEALTAAVEAAVEWVPGTSQAPLVGWIRGELGAGPERLVETTTT